MEEKTRPTLHVTRSTPRHFSALRRFLASARLGLFAALAVLALFATVAPKDAMATDIAPRRLALLVGIGQYADKRIPALEGPAHDIEAVQASLQQHWGFAARDIVVLRDRAATRAGILGAIEQLERESRSGDQILLYFSGHGTSASDRAMNLPLPHSSGAFVPYDLRMEGSLADIAAGLVVGARDLRPRLARLDAGGRQVLVVSDSCYSGQAVRMLGTLPGGVRLRPRHVPLEAESRSAAAEGPATRNARASRPEPEPYPYRRVFYIAAASDSEPAMDIGSDALAKLPTIDGRPHGALTDALLRALTGRLPNLDANRDGAIDQGELFGGVQRFMAARAYSHTPQALPAAREDSALLARARLFATLPKDGGPAVPAPDTGAAAGIAARPSNGTAAIAPVPVGGAVEAPAATQPPRSLRVRLLDTAEPPPALRGMPGVQWLAADASSAATLAGTAGAKNSPDPAPEFDFALETEALPWRLRSPAGDLVLEAAQDAAAHVRRRLAATAWLRNLQAAAEHPGRARMALDMHAVPATRGGTFVEGEAFTLAVRAERGAAVLVLVVDAEGRISTLYPYRGEEGQRHAANAVVQTPPATTPLRVAPPFGTDELLAVAFEQPPEWWSMLPVREALSPGHPLLAGLERSLQPTAQGGAASTIGLAVMPIRSVPRPR